MSGAPFAYKTANISALDLFVSDSVLEDILAANDPDDVVVNLDRIDDRADVALAGINVAEGIVGKAGRGGGTKFHDGRDPRARQRHLPDTEGIRSNAPGSSPIKSWSHCLNTGYLRAELEPFLDRLKAGEVSLEMRAPIRNRRDAAHPRSSSAPD